MPTTIPVVPRTVNTGDISRLGISIEDCFAVVLFGGIGLLATLIAIICDVHGYLVLHTQRIYEKVALLAFDLLACIIAMRIDTRPPFSALFTLSLSMIAAV